MKNLLFLFVFTLTTIQVFSQTTTIENQKQQDSRSSKDENLNIIITNKATFYLQKSIKKNGASSYTVKTLDLRNDKNACEYNSGIVLVIGDNSLCGETDRCLNLYLSSALGVTFGCDENGINVVGKSWSGSGLISIRLENVHRSLVEDAINCDPLDSLRIENE